MKKEKFEIAKSFGKETVEGYIYKGFGIVKSTYPSIWQWGATIIESGLKLANAPTRKLLLHKLDIVLELVPDFVGVDKEGQLEKLRKAIPENMGLGVFAHWLNPQSFDDGCTGRITWDQFKETQKHV